MVKDYNTAFLFRTIFGVSTNTTMYFTEQLDGAAVNKL